MTSDSGCDTVADNAREGLVQELLRLLRRDRLVRYGLIILVLTAAMVIFVSLSQFPLEHPLAGVLIYSLLPVFFIIGAIVFILAILRH